MLQFTGQDMLSFIKKLPNDEACKAYLAKIKWQDGFICSKCSHTKGCEKAGYNYHCYSCHHVESATANTLFHKVKFGLQKAFCVVFEMSTSSKSVSSIQMGKRFSIRQGTAWSFMRKVRKAMASSQKYPLSKLVHVDEFTVGGKEEGKQSRSYDTKKEVIAVELTDNNKVKRVYIKGLKDYSAKSLTPIFEEHISTSAKIVTDKWRGYEPLKEIYNIEQKYSNNGKNFKQLHIVIMQVKSWLRAIPTHVSKWHIQVYFDEFCFRINRSQFQQSIFHKTINRMVISKPIYQDQIKQTLSV
ncbi:IS1595 family transposase [Tenacibaculum finnmarkense]|uniref:IS1595 family transposase n=1 Tax=Tenacibaculum finnmarkense genomovar finnmarkense TaxID=1458503 RepID=A0AAP1WH87_9FLAO|nr:IS1595 family transposase [Tenacibaculum finnmarkense]MBE7653886.1 IS1595 family transposase [Tenacibaculum finnmarkense genomovar finnmarkense]MBE7696189.1 IS1595 family transposase [Tenacibaculum finnmarkense genomovar finnmarkense]MCD8428405.1 IS1595 family transposase [Tenacibaculum finnmarkense genomovar finnmarkense]MCG8732177.1 IS1595 family transposase [Tenacibaculum finnmarkense]MCG8752736.1 IS1595 family transposase [Tenacibaculum finnmarkense]